MFKANGSLEWVLWVIVLVGAYFVFAATPAKKLPNVNPNDPSAWCDAPPVDGAGAPAACN